MSSLKTVILAIETSCDETAVSVLRADKDHCSILSNIVSSQVKLHAKWGGVVPNLAAREHVKNFPRVLEMALGEAGVSPADIDLIAVTNGPGLIPALLVGTGLAKTLAYVWSKPLVGIHHIEGHIYANFISNEVSVISNDQLPISKQNADSKIFKNKYPSVIENCKLKIDNSLNKKFPILCLVVSGGHTQLVLMKNHLHYEIIGQTLDDAAGEAFDKVARILNIGYPGGPAVARWAMKFEIENSKFEISFPRPMMNRNNFDFSFSGLKTAVLYETKKHPDLMKDKGYISTVCHEFQQAVVDVLVGKTIKAAEKYQPKTILLAGGVSANKELREQLGKAIEKHNQSNRSYLSYSTPRLDLTGDNAAMIGAAAAVRWQKMPAAKKKETLNGWKTLATEANMELR